MQILFVLYPKMEILLHKLFLNDILVSASCTVRVSHESDGPGA